MAPVIPDSVEKGNPDDKLILYGWGTINDSAGSMSPFVGKVEAFLRMNGIPYEVEALKSGLGKSPKKMAPFIEHGDVLLADSTFILEYLANTYADKLQLNFHTDPLKNGIAVAAQRICEDHLVPGILWHRWVSDEGFEGLRKVIFKSLPFPFSCFTPGKFRKNLTKKSYGQGFARHSRNDVFKLLERSMGALSGILGKSKYITSDKPCPEDCAIFGVLDLYLNSKIIENDPLRDLVMKHDNLVAYVNNMHKELYPEDNPSKFKAHKI